MPRKPPKPPPNIGRLRELLYYDPVSGIFTWKVSKGSGGEMFIVNAGDIAGGQTVNGYVTIGIDGTPHLAHRLAWFYHFGEWPHEIDHRDRNRSNNSIDNLRSVTHHQNCLNSSLRSPGESGIRGVARKRNKWRAYIRLNGKQKTIGHFETAVEAAAAYAKFEAEFRGN